MKLTFMQSDGRLFTLDVANSTLFSFLCSLVATETNIPESRLILIKNGEYLRPESMRTIEEIGLSNDDLIIINISNEQPTSSLPAQTNIGVPVIDFSTISVPNQLGRIKSDMAESFRQHLLSAPSDTVNFTRQRIPKLVDALNDPAEFKHIFDAERMRAQTSATELSELERSDQFDPQVQQRIAELIQQRNIDREMEAAIEFYPETFGQVTMLYVNCEVNDHPIKAFVDSGAQTTIMSLSCASRCNLERLIDKRWAGMAYGVGQQTIIGRIHHAHLKMGGNSIPSSFVVLENQPMDLMIGLDMLKRHHCCIDLRRNVLTIGENTQVSFLPESELPCFAKHSEDVQRNSVSDTILDNLTDEEEVKVTLLTSQNIPRARAISLLRENGWDPDIAYMKNHQ